jgi:methionyl aminopeptidase
VRIVIKSRREIELMRAAGRVVWQVLVELERMVRPGVSTAELDARADELIRASGGVALFKGVRNPQVRVAFPACICASVNEEVVHGIPCDRPLAEGDIVSVDCGVRLHGYCGDAARTFPVGRISAQTERLLAVTQAALGVAVRAMRPGLRWSTVARQMQACVEQSGFGVVRDFVGHGIGQEMHEDPKVPNYYDRRQREVDFELRPGVTLAIEPMVTAGRPEVKAAEKGGWAVVTKDGAWAAHFEDTVALTEQGVEVLTDGR